MQKTKCNYTLTTVHFITVLFTFIHLHNTSPMRKPAQSSTLLFGHWGAATHCRWQTLLSDFGAQLCPIGNVDIYINDEWILQSVLNFKLKMDLNI